MRNQCNLSESTRTIIRFDQLAQNVLIRFRANIHHPTIRKCEAEILDKPP